MAAAVLTIDINARLASLEQALSRIPGAFQQSSRKVESEVSRLNSTVLTYGRTALAAFGVPLGIGALLDVIGTIKDKTIEGERSLNQLTAVLKATGGAAGLTAKQLAGIADNVQSKTIFDDDAIRASETALLRFRTIQGDVFRQAIEMAPDVAAALGVTLPEAATALGRALTDPEHGMKALKAAGLVLSDQQKDLAARMIEAGDKAGAQKLVLDELRKSVGGASEADNTGLYGSSKRLSRAWDDLQKAFGRKIFGDNQEAVGAFTDYLDRLGQRLDRTKVKWTDFLDQTKTRSMQSAALQDLNSLGNALITPPTGRRGSRSATGRITGQVDPEQVEADAAAAAQKQSEADNQAYNDLQASLKKRADGAAAYYNGIFAIQKAGLDAQAAALESSYQHNEISTEAYYSRQRAIVESGYAAQYAALVQQTAAQKALTKIVDGVPPSREQLADADAKLEVLAQQFNANEATRTTALEKLNRAQADAISHLIDDYAALNIQVLEFSGNSVLAANAAFELSHKDLRARIAQESQSANPNARALAAEAAADLDRLKSLTILQAQLNDATKTYSLTLDEVGIAEQNINSAREAGSLTELGALAAVSAARAGKLEQLKQELAAVEAIAAASGKREDLVRVEQLRAKLTELAATGDLVAKKFNDIGSGALSDLIQQLASGTKSLKDSLLDAGKSLSASITKVAADQIGQAAFGKDGPLAGFGTLFSKLFGGTAKDAAGTAALTGSATALTTSGTLLGTAATALSASAGALSAAAAAMGAGGAAGGAGGLFGLFGSTGASAGSGASAAPIGEMTEYFPYGGGYASGTPYVPRDALYTLHTGERVVPRERNRAGADEIRSIGRERSINVVQHINVMPGASTRSATQAAALAGRQARAAVWRNG